MTTTLQAIYGPKLRESIAKAPKETLAALDEEIIRMAKAPLHQLTVTLEVAKDEDNNIYEYVEFVPTSRFVQDGALWLANERFALNYTFYRDQASFLFPPHLRGSGPLFPWE